jgi:hypothetical protein
MVHAVWLYCTVHNRTYCTYRTMRTVHIVYTVHTSRYTHHTSSKLYICKVWDALLHRGIQIYQGSQLHLVIGVLGHNTCGWVCTFVSIILGAIWDQPRTISDANVDPRWSYGVHFGITKNPFGRYLGEVGATQCAYPNLEHHTKYTLYISLWSFSWNYLESIRAHSPALFRTSINL